MDADRDLYSLKKYSLTNLVDGQAVPNIVNVTFIDPRLYAEKASRLFTSAGILRFENLDLFGI
jgi:hypothetical protein